MSGGFFRGTSAEQDTRFSNKQAKLLKSQKFAPELEHLVDMSKVKMDVLRPWIATRVTELLGFEDEVLINFIYGLLDGKVVNGKEVQISLTGFMEKNTGKFMKELWTLLLSAQENASGVPQQFLDAKEEETRKKKVETDRIANEIQRKKEKEKEGRDLDPEKTRKMDDKADVLTANNVASEPSSKHQAQDYSVNSADEKEIGQRNGSRGRSRGTRSRSISKSFSNSRSYSGGRHKSRSISKSPQPRGSSISSDRMRHSMLKRSVTPPRRYSPRHSRSPPRRRSSHSRRRSSSRSRRRSLSPTYRRLRSPLRHRSRSPMQRRSRSPIRRRSRTSIRYRSRSPIRRRSPSPMRRRSPTPIRHRSPSPYRRRSPSPVRHRSISPSWRRSRSPVRRRSPLPVKRHYRRSPSPRYRSQTPIRRRSPVLGRRRSPTPPRHRSASVEEWSSQSPVLPMSQSPVRRRSPRLRRSLVQSDRERIRPHKKLSPDHKGQDSVRRVPVSLRSPQRNPRDQVDYPRKAPAPLLSPNGSQSLSGSPPGTRRSASEDRSPCVSPVKKTMEHLICQISASPPRKARDHKSRHDSPGTSGEEEESKHARDYENEKHKSLERRPTYSLATDDQKKSSEKANLKDGHTTDLLGYHRPTEAQSHSDGREARKDLEMRRDTERTSKRVSNHEVSGQQQSQAFGKDPRQHISYPEEGSKADEKNLSHLNDVKSSRRHESESQLKSIGKINEKVRSSSMTTGLQESNKHQSDFDEKRKHKRSKRQETESDDSYDSEMDERREAKRRRKEEKRLRKEERRRRKEERRRRREERRAGKRKTKSYDTVTPPSDNDKSHDGSGSGSGSDGERTAKGGSYASDAGLTESEQQKKLEFELRNKALESLKAKKGTAH